MSGNSNKSMPYYIKYGAMEQMKCRSKAAVARAALSRSSIVTPWRVTVIVAFAACVIAMLFAYIENREHIYYEILLRQMEQAPEEYIYELAADVVEYPEEIIWY